LTKLGFGINPYIWKKIRKFCILFGKLTGFGRGTYTYKLPLPIFMIWNIESPYTYKYKYPYYILHTLYNTLWGG